MCPRDKKKIDFFDEDLPGFLLEVRQSGGKTFYQRYRDSRGRERQYKIGLASILTAKEAREKARRIAAEAALGRDPQVERQALRNTPTLRNFADYEYLPFAKANKRSWKTDETLLRLHVLPALGRYSMDEITDKQVSELRSKLLSAGYSSGTLNRTTILIKHMFNQARRWSIPGASSNPAVGFKIMPDVCRERFLSPAETKRLMQALDDDENRIASAAIRLLALTGARRNEITHARWEHVDWSRRTLLVPLSKNGKARLIKLSEKAISLLQAHPRQPENPFIFPAPTTGKPPPSLFFPWSRIRKRAGLEDLRLHDLRHSFASSLVNKNMSIYTVQRLLGHSNIRSTLRYSHLNDETLSEAVEVIGKLFDAAEGGN